MKSTIAADKLEEFKRQILELLSNQNSLSEDGKFSSNELAYLSSYIVPNVVTDVNVADDVNDVNNFNDDDENNIWTLAAVNGASKIIEFLVNKLFDLTDEDLGNILHFQNKVRENSIVRVIRESRVEEIKPIPDSESFNIALKSLQDKMAEIENSKEFLAELKRRLDVAIESCPKFRIQETCQRCAQWVDWREVR